MMALLRSVAGLIGWGLAFSMLYGLHGLSCALGWHEVQVGGLSVARLILLLTYFGWIAALGWLCLKVKPVAAKPDLLSWLSFASAIAGLVSTIYTGFPVLAAGLCYLS